jgi:hypothetical protein
VHLAQHGRIDEAAAEALRVARSFDRADGPRTRHLAGLDVVDPAALPVEEQMLTVSHLTGVTPRSEKDVNMFEAESYIGHKLCWPDDLVINSLWAWGRGLGVARDHGIVSTAYGVYRGIKACAKERYGSDSLKGMTVAGRSADAASPE